MIITFSQIIEIGDTAGYIGKVLKQRSIMIEKRHTFMNIHREKRLSKFPLRLASIGYVPDNFHEPYKNLRDEIICGFIIRSRGDMVMCMDDGSRQAIEPPAGMLSDAGHRGWLETSRPWDELFFSYPPEAREALKALGLDLGQLHGRLIPVRDPDYFERKVAEIVELCRQFHLEGVLDRLDLAAFDLMTVMFMPAENSPLHAMPHPAVRRVATFIRKNFPDRIDLAGLLRENGVSARTFHREWNKVFEISPLAYLIELRIGFARELLRSTRYNLKEIAGQCGFGGVVDLCRHFRKRCGATPTAYRKQFHPTCARFPQKN